MVCDLIEGMRPPGVIAILNDVCATVHGVTNTADTDFQKVIKIYPIIFSWFKFTDF